MPDTIFQHLGLGTLPILSDAKSRSISAENPTGDVGGGARGIPNATNPASELGKGWKVRPCITLPKNSIVTLADIKGPGTITHIWTGSFHHGARRTAALGLGVMAGAQLGAYLSSRIKGSWIIRGLALGVIVVGVRIIIATFA